MNKTINLPNRLKTIADLIEPGARVIDVGTDHGYLPVYLAQSGIARNIIASDISAGSLAAALRSAEKYDVTEKIEFVIAPGLSGVSDLDVDTIVIAGVGGETISSILEDAPWTKNGHKLILQPQTKKEELIRFLQENGYNILDTKHTSDKGRDYMVLLARGEAGGQVLCFTE